MRDEERSDKERMVRKFKNSKFTLCVGPYEVHRPGAEGARNLRIDAKIAVVLFRDIERAVHGCHARSSGEVKLHFATYQRARKLRDK